MAEQSNYTATNLPQDGEDIDASDVNTDLQGLIDEFNKDVGSSKLADGSVTAAKLSTSAITLGYDEITSDFTTTTVGSDVDVTDLAVTVTVPSGGRRVKITAYAYGFYTTATTGTAMFWTLKEGTTTLAFARRDSVVASDQSQFIMTMYSAVVSAGSHTYKMTVSQTQAGTLRVQAGATSPAFILVEMI